MATTISAPQPLAIPVGAVKSFGPYGPEYEVLGPAEAEDGHAMIRVVLVRTGEEVTYRMDEMLQDPEAL